MADQIPSALTLRERLSGLTHAQILDLAERADVPFTTLWKIRNGETTNPRVDTVRKFWLLLPERRNKARA